MIGAGKLSPAMQAVLVLAICACLNALGRGITDSYMVFLLPLQHSFGWSRGSLTSVYSICMLVSGFSSPLVGAALDRFGPRAVYGVGMATLAIGFSLAAHLDAIWQFRLVVGGLSGIGVAALGVVPASALLARWFHARLSTAMGVAYAGFGLGSLALSPLVQILIETYGWRETYSMLGLSLAALVPVVLALPWRRIAAGRGDWPVKTGGGQGAGAIAAVRQAMHAPIYWLFAQVYFFTALAIHMVNVQVVAFLVDYGFTPLIAATAYGAAAMLSVVGIAGSGWVTSRVGHGRATLLSFFGTCSGVLALFAITISPAAFLMQSYVFLYGICQGARGPIVSTLVARNFPGHGLGAVYGTIYAIGAVGSALGAWASGWLHDLSGGYRANFACSLVMLAIAAYPFLGSKKTLFDSKRVQ